MSGNPFSGGTTEFYYVNETETGVMPTNPELKLIRSTGGMPTITKEPVISAELGGGREINGIRTGNRQVGGEWTVELSHTSYDDFLEGALGSTWVTGVAQSDVEITVDAANKTYTRTLGDFVSDGVQVGDLFAATGLTGDNAFPFIVTSVTSLVITGNAIKRQLTDETLITDYKTGDSLRTGSECKTVSVVAWYKGPCGTVDAFQEFYGVSTSGFSIEAGVNALVTGSFPFLGRASEIKASLPAGATFAPVPETRQFNGVDGKIILNNEVIGYITSDAITNENADAAQFVLGDEFASFVERGNAQNTFSMSGFFEDLAAVQLYLDDAVVSTHLVMAFDGTAMSFSHPQAVLTNVAPERSGESSLTQTIDGQSFGNENVSSLVVQRITY